MNSERQQAQQRSDDILAFRRELQRLQEAGVLQLPPPTLEHLAHYHRNLLQRHGERFGVDHNPRMQQLSLGMRAASLIGAVALAASLVFIIDQFWSLLGTAQQLGLLALISLLTLVLALQTSQRDRHGHFAMLTALLALASLVAETWLLGAVLDLPPSELPLLAWSGWALLLAQASRSRLVLRWGLLFLILFIAALSARIGGFHWRDLASLPELWLPSGLLLLAISRRIGRSPDDGFAACWRQSGLYALLLPVLLLGHWGGASLLPLPQPSLEIGYQLLGLLLCGLCIGAGIQYGWREVSQTGVLGLLLLLYLRLFDWCWQRIPHYLFFLLVGLLAVLALAALYQLHRHASRQEAA